MAEGGTFAIARYLKEGKDAFGREASGSKGIVLVMNRSAEPLFVDVRENYGAYTCVRTGDDEARPPLSEQLIVGGVTGGVKKLGIKPYSTVFLVY